MNLPISKLRMEKSPLRRWLRGVGKTNMIKKIYKIEGMHCSSCAMLIEGELEDRGVKAKCSYVKQSLEVEYDQNKIKETEIKIGVAAAGYKIKE